MTSLQTRIRIESDLLARMGGRHSEEEIANHLMSVLLDDYPLLSAVLLSFDEGKLPVVVAHRGLSGNFIKDLYAKGTLPLVQTASAEEVVVAGDDPRISDPAWRMEHAYRSLFAAPCRIQGETLGVFLADSPQGDLFSGETRSAFQRYAQLCAILLAQREHRRHASRVPDVDDVTGLHTFKFFHEVLHREMTHGRRFHHPVSLLIIKVRHLREMNEVHGHLVSDRALSELAATVRGCVREVDFVARSGSSIYVVLPRMGKDDAAVAAESIRSGVEAAAPGSGGIRLKVAIGVVSFPKDGDTERVLIPHAESMVHEAMRKGGNAVAVFRD